MSIFDGSQKTTKPVTRSRVSFTLHLTANGPHANVDICSGNLDKTKVTGFKQVDTLQDGINDLAASQIGQGGLLQPAGGMVSEHGLTRTERRGMDDKGGYVN
jgi:hypothetical protein